MRRAAKEIVHIKHVGIVDTALRHSGKLQTSLLPQGLKALIIPVPESQSGLIDLIGNLQLGI